MVAMEKGIEPGDLDEHGLTPFRMKSTEGLQRRPGSSYSTIVFLGLCAGMPFVSTRSTASAIALPTEADKRRQRMDMRDTPPEVENVLATDRQILGHYNSRMHSKLL